MSMGGIDAMVVIREMQARQAASPHRCADGCGTHVLVAGQWCGDCDVRRYERQRRRERSDATLASIPQSFRWSRLDAPELASRVRDPRAIAQARAILASGVDRVVLTGPAGAGKTSLGVAMMRAAADTMGVAGGMADGYELSTARAHERLGHEATVVELAMTSAVLLLDELRGDGSPTTHDATSDVIHRRHARRRPTIITCGYTMSDIQRRYGDGIARRVYEGADTIDMRPGGGR